MKKIDIDSIYLYIFQDNLPPQQQRQQTNH